MITDCYIASYATYHTCAALRVAGVFADAAAILRINFLRPELKRYRMSGVSSLQRVRRVLGQSASDKEEEMKRLNDVLTANCLAFALLYTAAATAQQIQTPNTFFDNFEALEVGPLEGQPGEGFPRDWFSQRDPTMVTEEQANSGTKSIVFASGGANGFGRVIHVGFLDNDPALGLGGEILGLRAEHGRRCLSRVDGVQ